MSQFPLALQDRRLSVRRRVQIVALLHCHRLCRSVLIADYSREGLLLESTCAVSIGERATVALLSGHRLPVQVMWVAGTHLGVRFFGIQAGHPGLLALWEAVRKYLGLSGLTPSKSLIGHVGGLRSSLPARKVAPFPNCGGGQSLSNPTPP
jgi:PilZ domain